MNPLSNQSMCSFATAKTYKFNKIEDVNIEALKLRAIIDQTSIYI